jgi:hypothetical protein
MDYSEAKGQSANVLFLRTIRLGSMDTLCFVGDGFATEARHVGFLSHFPGSEEKNSGIMRPPAGTRTLKRAGMRLLGSAPGRIWLFS